MVQGVIYIISMVLQLSGAVLLIANYWSKRIDEYILLEINKEHNDDCGSIDDDEQPQITKDDYKNLAQQVCYNRFAFIYIALGYILSPIADNCLEKCCEVFQIIVFSFLLYKITAYAISRIINKEMENTHIKFDIIE